MFGIKGNNRTINFKGNLTILVGKNGCGKTTILNILNAIFTKSFAKLAEYDFRKIQLESDEGNIVIRKSQNIIEIRRVDIRNITKKCISLSEPALNKLEMKLNSDDPLILTNFNSDKTESQFKEVMSMLYLEIPTNQEKKQEFEQLIRQFAFNVSSMYFPTYRRTEVDFANLIFEPDAVSMRSYKMFQQKYLFEERFIDLDNVFNGTVVGFSNKDIRSIVEKRWNRISQIEKTNLSNLIKNYLFSLLDPLSTEEFDYNKILDTKPGDMKKDIEEVFIKTGLITSDEAERKENIGKYVESVYWAKECMDNFGQTVDKGKYSNIELAIKDINSASEILFSHRKVHTLIKMFRDTCRKTDAIKAPFYNLTDILNDFLGKKVEIKDGKIKFIYGKDTLDFEDLSAGEKQLVALFVYTRLSLQKHSIVLIDEPELSLHIGWQRKFLSALTSGEKDIQYIVSTHSPFIISNYSNNIERLGELEEGDD
jgi:ABC-type lipoprotein export system ATPase subunit